MVKCEPEIQILECDPPPSSSGNDVSSHNNNGDGGVDPSVNCIAAAHNSTKCRGELLNLDKMTSNLDLVTKEVTAVQDSGEAATEKAIIKSRLRIPFWKLDEVS